MKNRIVVLTLIILLSSFLSSCTQKEYTVEQVGEVVATMDEGKITTGDIKDFKKYRLDDISNQQALEMIIENELLYREAKSKKILITIDEAKTEAEKLRVSFEENSSEEDKKILQDEINKLGITLDKYWNEYCPKLLMKSMSIGKMRNSIKTDFYNYVDSNHPTWGKAEIEEDYNKNYELIIEDLKKKYNVKYENI
ncbi:hypothetical protein [uncultured Clostridium sp.]|uniref:hypothetical protein n=1 Tax=uncultured Clostridium sp. TaxID=59620 RepID=UPI0028E25FF7|nr:hypothetical protein [uncultured Clostridium sp.]